MRPTARAILSCPLRPLPQAIRSASLPNIASVACSRSSRLRARSSARSGFLHTTSRSPGNSGAVISARSRSSNSESWNAPVSSRARICGALSAVIQSSAAGERRLDRGLAGAEPVERAIELGLVDGAELEQPAEARTRGIGGKIAGGGELGGGRDQAAGDQGDRQRSHAFVTRLAELSTLV